MSRIQDVIPESDSAFVSAARVIVGLFLLGTGVATFFIPDLRVTFIEQLNAADVPLQRLTSFAIPAIEGVAGAMLLGSFLTRLASFIAVFITAVLAYLHVVVSEPALFPPQFGLPVIPIVALILSAFLYLVDRYSDD